MASFHEQVFEVKMPAEANNFPLRTHCKGQNLALKGFKLFRIGAKCGIDRNSEGDCGVGCIINGVGAGIDAVWRYGSWWHGVGQNQQHYRIFIQYLTEAVQEGSVPVARVDDAVRRILKVKMELGLFDGSPQGRHTSGNVGSVTHRALARKGGSAKISSITSKNEKYTTSLS